MGILVTIIIFALLLLGLRKKLDIRILLLGLSLLILCYLTVRDGSVLADATTGNAILDIPAYIFQYLSANLGSATLPVILVFAYVEVLNRIHATDMMAYLVSIPIQKIKSVYLSVALVVLIGSLLRIPTGGGPALIALMLALFFPMLLGLGCSVETAAAAMLIYGNGAIGPADPSCAVAAQVMGIEVNPALWFTGIQLPYMLFSVPILIILFIVFSSGSDKKASAGTAAAQREPLRKPDCPAFYALLPLLPLVFMILFSPLVIPTVSMNVGTACLLSLLIVLAVVLLTSKRTEELQDNLKVFFAAIGNNITGIGLIMMAGMLFATCMSRVGGLNTVADLILAANMPGILTVFILCLFVAVIAMIMGSFYGALSVGLSLAASFVAASGMSEQLLCYLVLTSVFAGTCCSPANPGPAMIAAKTKIEVTTLIRRVFPPIWITLIVSIFLSSLVLH